MDQNKKAMIALLILASAAFGYWMWSKKSGEAPAEAPTGPSAADIGKNLSGYGVPPNIGVQTDTTGGTSVMTNGNSLPLPMNGG